MFTGIVQTKLPVYRLVRQKDFATFSFVFSDKFGYTATHNCNEKIPVRRNWRSNIVGQVLTDNGEIDIVFDPGYIDSENIEYREVEYLDFNIKSDTPDNSVNLISLYL